MRDSPAADHVVRTKVRRDGRLLGGPEGNGFFDDTRAPGGRYRVASPTGHAVKRVLTLS